MKKSEYCNVQIYLYISSQMTLGPRNEEQTRYPHIVLCLFRIITGRYVSNVYLFFAV